MKRAQHHRRSERGFSLLEMMIVVVVGAVCFLTIASLTKTTTALANQSQAHLSAEGRLREGLQQLCNVLRAVDLSTLGGFDEDTLTSSAPTFERIVGLTNGEALYSGAERIEWRTTTGSIPGVSQPGALWLVSPLGERQLARCVPYGGLVIRMDGDTLLVSLKVYHRAADGRVIDVAGETAITGRNDT